ncbi:hypothetical protein [Leifsonia aquatica]|uniref:hypothetical protein n=1 Tax=Leifsonia aquatica TaxID=144185 RepID=UPI0028A60125|nr:hypothetical protein [Leifsonia aquatica]
MAAERGSTIPTLLWSAAGFVAAVGAAGAAIGLLPGLALVSWGAYVLLLLAEMLLLATIIFTLRRENAFESVESLASLPAALRVGWWIGGLAAGLATTLMVFSTTSTHYPNMGSRFAVSLMAAMTLIAALFTASHVPGIALGVLSAMAGLVILTSAVRGVVGLFVRPSR